MTYNVFGGTLSLTQSISQSISLRALRMRLDPDLIWRAVSTHYYLTCVPSYCSK